MHEKKRDISIGIDPDSLDEIVRDVLFNYVGASCLSSNYRSLAEITFSRYIGEHKRFSSTALTEMSFFIGETLELFNVRRELRKNFLADVIAEYDREFGKMFKQDGLKLYRHPTMFIIAGGNYD